MSRDVEANQKFEQLKLKVDSLVKAHEGELKEIKIECDKKVKEIEDWCKMEVQAEVASMLSAALLDLHTSVKLHTVV